MLRGVMRVRALLVGAIMLWAAACQSADPEAQDIGGSGGALNQGQQCGASLAVCDALCVNLERDPDHCGGCDQRCSDGQVCSDGACQLQCGGGTTQCAGLCVDTRFDPAHCGGCDEACEPGGLCSDGKCVLGCSGSTVLCGGACVDTDHDPDHCGGCDEACPAGRVCVEGSCAVACGDGISQCGSSCVDLKSNPAHCGGCNKACATVANEAALCVDAQCQTVCKTDYADCNQDGSDGCEALLTSSNDHCGACGKACGPIAQATTKCEASSCKVDACSQDYGDCDNLYDNGCEVLLLEDANHCGACGNQCAVGEVCSGGNCLPACDITSVTSATLHTTQSPTQGQWMADPYETLGAGKLWVLPSYYSSAQVLVYDSLAQLKAKAPSDNYNLSVAREGTGAVIHKGFLYYNKANSRNLIKYDLQNKSVVLDVTLPNAGYHNTFSYQWGGYSDIDLAVDSQGLWAIYATNLSGGKIVVSKLNPATLAVTQSWTTSRMKNSSGNAFMVCGKLYVTSSYSQSNTTIAYKYDTKQAAGMNIAIPFTNPGNYNSQISYNHNDKKLYSWDSTRLQTYDVKF